MPPTSPQMPDPQELGRRGHRDALTEAVAVARRTGSWSALMALDHACAWLLAGDWRQADVLVLEADRLEPSFALVPDVWGLWPAPPLAAGREAEAAEARDRLERFRRWRLADAQALWSELLPQLQADWITAIEPEVCGDALLILSHLTAGDGVRPLEPLLEDCLAPLVNDAAIAAHPAAACRFWQLAATIRPGWGLARVRAADLCLSRGELEACARWLEAPPPAALANPWFHDVTARHAVQQGALTQALDAWSEALRLAQTNEASEALREVFEQRCREARRGPGVLQVRSLANRGETSAARLLLERLLADDPQWQPLLSLRDQLRESPPSTAPASPSTTPGAEEAPTADLDAFTRLLDRASARLQALGISPPLPQPEITGSAAGEDGDAAAAADQLDAYSRRLSDYEARFALA